MESSDQDTLREVIWCECEYAGCQARQPLTWTEGTESHGLHKLISTQDIEVP